MKNETGKAKHLIVISYDAFSSDNWERASGLPNLSKLIKSGAYSTKLKSVYPSITYVAHSTIVTGLYPDKHGIYHNNPFQPFIKEAEQRWFWYRDEINVPTIYDTIKEHKMTSAAILWPVTGKARINYNIPEIRAIGKENQILKVLKNGSPFYCINMEMKYGRIRNGIIQPNLDNFTTMCAVDTIKRKKPNLLLIHLIDLDDTKHEYGTDSNEIEKVLIRMDNRIGKIIKATEEAGIRDETIFLVIGDHGQINVKYKVKLNKILKEKGLIFEDNEKMKWRAYLQSAGGSAYLHIKEGDEEAEILALAILDKAISEDCYGIEKIYNRKELDSLHVAHPVRYMLEAKSGYCFDDSLDGPIFIDMEKQRIKYANHGYSPDKPNYKCIFVISGGSIKKEYQLGDIEMVDIAPTMAKILGVNYNNCNGRPLDEIFHY